MAEAARAAVGEVDAGWAAQSLAEVRFLALPRHGDTRGSLVALDTPGLLPGGVERVFTVTAGDSERGEHALLTCWQALICVSGHCDVTCDDGWAFRRFRLSGPEQVLVLPPAVWRGLAYPPGRPSVLVALCNRPYDPEDYIDDYARYLGLRGRPRPGTAAS